MLRGSPSFGCVEAVRGIEMCASVIVHSVLIVAGLQELDSSDNTLSLFRLTWIRISSLDRSKVLVSVNASALPLHSDSSSTWNGI